MGSLGRNAKSNMSLASIDKLGYEDIDTKDGSNIEDVDEENEPQEKNLDLWGKTEQTNDDRELFGLKFLQLPQARQDLLINCKKELEKAISSPYETFGNLIETGSSKIKPHLKPAERALESGSNFVKSYQEPMNNLLQSGVTLFDTVKQPMINMQEVVMSSSNMIVSKMTTLAGLEHLPS